MSVRPRAAHRRSCRQHHDLAALKERSALIKTLLDLPFVDPDQASVVGQVSPSSVRRACASGALRHVRVNGGKLIRIRPPDLMAWLNGALQQAS
jgi:hypothetical protein